MTLTSVTLVTADYDTIQPRGFRCPKQSYLRQRDKREGDDTP